MEEKNWIPTSRKKSPNERILFQVDKKLVLTSRNGNLLKNAFLLDEKTAYTGRNVWKI